ncbi:MAG: hypothetical protein R2764_11110 [Bacteroidales bacterium]
MKKLKYRYDAILFVQVFIWLVLVIASCSKEDTEKPEIREEFKFYTNKSYYHDLEDIVANFQNNTSSVLHVDWCRLFYLEREENGIWESIGSPPCPYDGSFIICNPGEMISDIMESNWLDNGRYRLVTYISGMDTTQRIIYSNEFEKTDFALYIQ